jgi:hypothetical protein
MAFLAIFAPYICQMNKKEVPKFEVKVIFQFAIVFPRLMFDVFIGYRYHTKLN